jgi:hypothetical protein
MEFNEKEHFSNVSLETLQKSQRIKIQRLGYSFFIDF